MNHYLVDTNHLSPLVTLNHYLRDKIVPRLQTGDKFAVATPVLTELLFGISILPRAKQNLYHWQQLEAKFIYHDVDRDLAQKAAQLQVALRSQGWQLATVDALIAVVALRYNLTLLTSDKDFQRIPTLRQENWLR